MSMPKIQLYRSLLNQFDSRLREAQGPRTRQLLGEIMKMSDIVDIEIVVDTANLIAANPNPSKDPKSPTGVGHNYAYMVAPSEYVKSGQASGDLSISVDVGDTIRWRMTSQS